MRQCSKWCHAQYSMLNGTIVLRHANHSATLSKTLKAQQLSVHTCRALMVSQLGRSTKSPVKLMMMTKMLSQYTIQRISKGQW